MEAKLREALKNCIYAMKESINVGCTDHLDCWGEPEDWKKGEGAALWYNSIQKAEELLKCDN